MKNLIFTIALLSTWTITQAQVNNVGIGTTTPDPSAILELQATDQGFLMPRMDQSGENALPSPAQGLMIYNTNVNNAGNPGVRHYDGTLWNSALSQKSTGEIFLDNLMTNFFNIQSAADFHLRRSGNSIFEVTPNDDFRFGKFGTNKNLWFKTDDLSLYADDGTTLQTLSIQNYAVFDANGDVTLNRPGNTDAIRFVNGNHIEATTSDGTAPADLELNNTLKIEANGDVTIDDEALIQIVRYDPNPIGFFDNGFDTGVSTNDYNAFIGGFGASVTWQQHQHQTISHIHMFKNGGTWHVFRSVNFVNTPIDYTLIDVVFIKKEISSINY